MRALSTGEVQQAVEDFVVGAERAQRAGFDGVEVHGAHGYLLCQFLDGRHNHRTDGYGGSLEWATSCPPPRHNFTSIPRIRSEAPAFDLNHPEAGIPVGIGPAKDAPDAPTYDKSEGTVK